VGAPKGNVAKLVNLEQGEGSVRKAGQRRKVKGQRSATIKEKIGKQDEKVMQRHNPLPAKPGQECTAIVFRVRSKGRKSMMMK